MLTARNCFSKSDENENKKSLNFGFCKKITDFYSELHQKIFRAKEIYGLKKVENPPTPSIPSAT